MALTVAARGDAEPSVEERLVKSTERVRDLGEVFTPSHIVQAMLDLLPDDIWTPHPSPTFFEPAAGDGNFLVAILDRKLEALASANDLPGSVELHALEALASIYAVDISPDNVIGGTPGHEIGARTRLLDLFANWWRQTDGATLTDRTVLWQSACWIVDHNVLVGNMLTHDADGNPTGREKLPLVQYRWDPHGGTVTVATTTLGAVMDAAAAQASDELVLFGSIEDPIVVWNGPARDLRDAPVPTPPVPHEQARNGKRRG